MAAAVTVKVSGLNPGASSDRVKGFFEGKGEDISVGSCIFHDDGTALVKLFGATQEELERLLSGSHKLLKCPIQLEVVPSSECERSSVSSLIEVRGAVGLDEEELEVYFEAPRAGGRKGSVKSCVIDQDGVARIEFDSPEVVEEIMSITKHSVLGVPLKVTYPSSPDQQAGSRPSKIWLTEMPSVLMNDTEYLAALLGRTIGHELVFSLTQVNSTTLLLEFSEEVHLSEKELVQIVEKLGKKQVKGIPLKPTLALVPPVTKAMPKKKWKLLVSKSEQHLLLLLEKFATNMENDKDFSINFAGDRDCVVTLEQNLSDEEVECFVHMIEPKLHKKQIGVKVIDCCQLLLSELPSIEMDHLALQIAKVIGKEKEFVLKESKNKTAVLKFKRSIPDPDLDAVVAVIAKTKVKGVNIKVQKLELPYVETPPSTSSPCRLLLSGVPSVDIEYLGLRIEQATGLEYGTDFILEEQDENLTLMTLKKQLSEKELEEAIGRINKTTLKGKTLMAAVFTVKEAKTSSEDSSSLLLQGMPNGVDEEYLGVVLSKAMKIDENEFSVKCLGSGTALLTFKQCLSDVALQDRIRKIEMKPLKGTTIKAVCWKTTPCIFIRNITEHYYEDFLTSYFENTIRSGGGEVESVELFGNGEAKVMFKDLKVMRNVILKPHSVLGDVTVTQDNPLEKFTDSNHTELALQTISINVSPLLAEVLHGEEANLNRLLNNLHVSVSVDKDQAAINIVPSKHTPAGWMKCETSVKVYIDNNFATKDLPVSKDAALDIIKALQQRKRGELEYKLSEDSTLLHLVGHPNLLIQIQNQVCDIVANVTIIDKEITLNQEDYVFLLQTKQQDITHTFPGVKTTFIPPSNIKVNGAVKDVKIFEESVLRLSAHSSVTMVLDPLLTDFLCTNQGREQTRNYISSLHGICVAVCIKGSGNNCTVLVLCDPKITEKVNNAVRDVQKKLLIEKLTVSSKCQAKLSYLNTNKEYNELCEQLQKKHGVIVKMSKDSICVAGFKDKVSQAIAGFKEFIDIKCKVASSIIVEDGAWQLLQGHMKSEWDSLLKCAKDVEVVLRSDIKNTSTTIKIHGQVDSVDRIYNAFLALQQKILRKDIHPHSSVIGFQEHAKSNVWKTFIPGIESVHKVCISVVNSSDGTESDAKEVEIKGCDNSVAPIEGIEDSIMSPLQSMWNSSKLKCVKIHKGSLLDVKADVYVNSTNNSLDFSGDVISKMLVDAAGPTLQEQCSRRAPIVFGQIAITGSGNIKCRHIFHLALNNYDGPGGNAEKVLKESVDKCLDECRQQKISSIAFPALGTGVLSFPPQVAAKIMMESVGSMKDSAGLAVHIVISLDTVHKAFEEMKGFLEQSISSPFGTESKQAYQPQKSLSTCDHKKSSTKLYTSPLQTTRLSDNKLNVNGVTVEIVQGDITDQTCDVIVSSTRSSDMKSTFGVSGAILKKGGPELVKASETYIEKNRQLDVVGKVVATPASGGLKCKTVFHINVNPALLESAVTECLKEADRQKYLSISFPALTTGNHKSSADKVASEMLKAIQQYALQNTRHTTSSIFIVVFELDLFLPFLSALQSFSSEDTCIDTQGQRLSSRNDSVPKEYTVSPFFFRIFGNHKHGIKTAAEFLTEHLNKNFICENVPVESVEFKPSPEVMKLCSDNYVTLDHDATLSTITLTGQKAWVDTISKKIVKDNIQLASFRREAELLQKQVEWQHQISDKYYVAYSPEINLRIEEAFKAKQLKYYHDDPSDSFCIDFQTLTKTNTKPYSSAVPVRREDLLARYTGETPKTWEKMSIDPLTQKQTMYQLFSLKNTSQEYIGVHQKFASTVPAQKIISIQRVQNYVLYGLYSARKKAMENLFPPGIKYENLLFHGTRADTCQKINIQGFYRSFAGLNATAYGKGVYFAVNASYSAQPTYSPPDTNGHRYMYLVRVLTGEYTLGNQSMIVPPSKNPAKDPNVLFDSLVDNMANPSMYIIFQDAQAYPEYLITFVV